MSSTAPKRRLDVREQTARNPENRGGRRAAMRPRRAHRSLRPSPAMVGAVALIVAGVGAAGLSGRTDGGALQTNYQTISAAYTGGSTDGDVDVSRDFDRNLEQQATQQAEQVLKAQQELGNRVEAAAEEFKAKQWVIPVTGYRLSARFGQRGGLWSSGMHTGLDFSGPSGSTIVSVASGTVTSVGYAGAYGNRTIVTLDDGTEVWYCHQSRVVVRQGQRVMPGEVIGYTGSTGNVTGPHLHLEVHPGGGGPIDPYTALVQHGVTP